MDHMMNFPDDFQHIVDNLFDGAYIVDRNRRILFWNHAAETITGFTPAEVDGKSCADNILIHVDAEGRSLCDSQCPLAATMTDGRTREAAVYLHHKAGHRVPVQVRQVALRDAGQKIVGVLQLFRETLSEKDCRQHLQELQELVLLDSMTRLPNRRYLESEIESAFSRFRRYGLPFGVLFFDVDHFKTLNDTYGHAAGDQALITIAETLRKTIRPQDTIGRWGGEEFLGIFPGVQREKLFEIGDRLRALVGQSWVHHGGKDIQLTVSAGGTLVRATDTLQSVVDTADTMMYRSKEAGRNCVTIA